MSECFQVFCFFSFCNNFYNESNKRVIITKYSKSIIYLFIGLFFSNRGSSSPGCCHIFSLSHSSRSVFLNRWAAAQYRALASIIPSRERPEETTVCYKISLVQFITNLNVILYLSTCPAVYISVLILFMIMP